MKGINYHDKRNRIYLIIDNYGARKCDEIMNYAINLNY